MLGIGTDVLSADEANAPPEEQAKWGYSQALRWWIKEYSTLLEDIDNNFHVETSSKTQVEFLCSPNPLQKNPSLLRDLERSYFQFTSQKFGFEIFFLFSLSLFFFCNFLALQPCVDIIRSTQVITSCSWILGWPTFYQPMYTLRLKLGEYLLSISSQWTKWITSWILHLVFNWFVLQLRDWWKGEW